MSDTDTLRVIVVDDDADFRLLMQVRLDVIEGVSVIATAGDGHEAIACVEADPPDAIVMDLLMPKMNGFEAIERLRRSHPRIGIVAYSAVAGDYARSQTEALGVELILKSGSQDEILAALRRSVEAGAGSDEATA